MRIYACLIGSLVAIKLVLQSARLELATPEQSIMFQGWFIVALSIYGAVGVLLIPRTGFAGMWATRRGVCLALVHGTVVGLCTIAIDVIRPSEEVLQTTSVHHPLPEGLLVYWYAAIVSEIWFHLLPVPLVVFAVSNIVLRRRHQDAVFWLAASLLSLWEGRRIPTDPELWVPVEVARGAVTYVANLSEIWLFRRFGFMTAVGQRLAGYAWWHILWPLAGKGVS